MDDIKKISRIQHVYIIVTFAPVESQQQPSFMKSCWQLVQLTSTVGDALISHCPSDRTTASPHTPSRHNDASSSDVSSPSGSQSSSASAGIGRSGGSKSQLSVPTSGRQSYSSTTELSPSSSMDTTSSDLRASHRRFNSVLRSMLEGGATG